MICKKCRNKRDGDYYLVCGECFSRKENLPANLHGSAWITVLTDGRDGVKSLIGKDEELERFILTSYYAGKIIPDSKREVVSIAGKMEVPVNDDAIDKLARKSGLVVGKWLIYASPEQINEVWKTVATAHVKNELGVNIKVSTASQSQSGEYVICVYTQNYLEKADVERVRGRLQTLGFTHRLYYKPDIYTYLQIYRKTFPQLRASRYSS